jgi:hypothetical protein
MAAKNQTQVDRWLKRLKNNRVVAVTIVVAIGLAGVAQFTKSIGDLLDFFRRYTNSPGNSQQQSALASGKGATVAAETEQFTAGQASPCAAEGGSAAVRAYALALVDPQGLAMFVRENATLFAADGPAVKCLQLLSSTVRHERIPELSPPRDPQRRTWELALPPDLLKTIESLPANQIASGVSEEEFLADNSARLSAVLPAVAAGDDTRYRTSFSDARMAAEIAEAAAKDPQIQKSRSEAIEEFVPAFGNYVRVVTGATPTPSTTR